MLIFALATLMGCSSNSDNSRNNNDFKYHKENVAVLSTVADSMVAEKMLSGLEDSCAIVNNTKLVAEDIIKHNDNCIELYAGLMMRFYIQDGEVLLYTFETVYSNDTAILLYDSAQVNPLKILTETERNSLIYTQREYVVHTTIEITPASGFVLHNALGTSKVQLTFKNKSDTAISSVDVLMTPYISGVSFESKNASYSMLDKLTVNDSLTKTVIIPEWSNYDTYKIIKVIVAFSDRTSIAFDYFDCQFLDGSNNESATPPIEDSTDIDQNESSSNETPPNVNDSQDSMENSTSFELLYKLSEDETYYIVKGYSGSISNMVIPNIYNGLPVKKIGAWAFSRDIKGNRNETLISVTIPKNIIEIEKNAFNKCSRLKEVFFESNSELTTIQEGAFASSAIIAITIPEKVNYIGYKAFHDCWNLSNVYITNIVGWKSDNLVNILSSDMADSSMVARWFRGQGSFTYYGTAFTRTDE